MRLPDPPPRRRLLALVLVAGLIVAACGADDSGADPRAPDPSAGGDARDRAAGRLADAADAVTRYVAALDAGDVEAAMAQRCAGARVTSELLPQFAAAADALGRELGGLEVASVRLSDLPEAPGPPGDPADLVDVLVALDTADGPGDEILVVTGVEDGERRVCASATREGGALIAFATDTLADLGATAAAPADLVPPPGSIPGEVAEDEGGPVRDEDGRVVGGRWTRSWERAGAGGVRVTAFRAAAASRARPDLEAFLGPVAADGIAGFELGDAPGAVGIRYRAESWLMVQPPDAGPVADRLHLLLGDTFVLVDVSGLVATDDHGEVEAIARGVLDRARG